MQLELISIQNFNWVHIQLLRSNSYIELKKIELNLNTLKEIQVNWN